MKVPKFLKCKDKNEVLCDHNEYCPVYLSYLGKYGENSEKVKLCKNPNVHYCKKYNLINESEWVKLSIEEKLKIIEDMELLKYIKKRED